MKEQLTGEKNGRSFYISAPAETLRLPGLRPG